MELEGGEELRGVDEEKTMIKLYWIKIEFIPNKRKNESKKKKVDNGISVCTERREIQEKKI